MARSILYYPEITISDKKWLRNSILYWDEISSIVPNTEYHEISIEMQYLQEEGIYRPLYPTDLFDTELKLEFIKEIELAITRMSKKLHNGYGKDSIYKDYVSIQDSDIQRMLHYNKLPEELMEIFKNNRFFETNPNSDWIRVHHTLADIYMTTLARYLVRIDENDMVIGTSSVSNLHSIYKKSYSGNKLQRDFCLTSLIERGMPMPNMDVPLKDILEFKRERRQELLKLRQELSKYEKKLSSSERIEEFKEILEDFKESWENEVSDLEKMLKDKSIRYYWGNMRNFIKLGKNGTGLFKEIINNPHLSSWVVARGLIEGAVGIGVSYVNHRHKIEESIGQSSFAYLYNGQQKRILDKVNN